MAVELELCGIRVLAQVPVPVCYEDALAGKVAGLVRFRAR